MRMKFHPPQVTRDIMAKSPGVSKGVWMTRVKAELAEEAAISRRKHTNRPP